MDAYLGSLPGHGVENVRRPLMNTMNLADLLPTSTIWTGQNEAPCPMYPPSSLSGLSPRAGGISVCEAVLPPGIPVLAGFWSHSPQLPSTSSLEAQCGHALQVPGQAHQAPFTSGFI
jgi:hypothetical protein